MRKAYGGITQSNPLVHPPFLGYWEDDGRVEVDELTTIIVLVLSADQSRALRDFTRWKRQLERRYNQRLVLIMYYPVQVLDDL